MNFIAMLLTAVMLFSNMPIDVSATKSADLAGPRENFIAYEGEETNSDASVFAIGKFSDTVSFVCTNNSMMGEYLKAEVTSAGEIKYSGNTDTPSRKYGIYLSSNRPASLKNVKTSDSNGDFSGSFKMSEVPEGVSYIWLYVHESSTGYFYLQFDGIPVIRNGNEIGIFKSEVTDNNIFRYNIYKDTDLSYYKEINKYCLTQGNVHYFEEYNEIIAKAQEITQGKTTPREKALAVHDWLCDNIYYDYDCLSGDISDAANARLVFETKRAVCSGFSRLFSIMLRSVGVACIDITGFAYQFQGGISWEDINSSSPNHEWNMFFDGERWCIVDSTWDCKNRYEYGTFTKGAKTHTYFDADVNYFSYTHKAMSNYYTKNNYYSRLDYPAFDGVVYVDTIMNSFVAYNSYGERKEYVIKDNISGMPVTMVYDYFLFGHENVESVFLPESIEEIGYAAFYGCEELKRFEFDGDDIIIGDYVLYNCGDDLTVYAKYKSDLYDYAMDEGFKVKLVGKPKVSKIEKKNSGYDIYYTYASLAPKEKIYCIVKDDKGNLKEVKIFELDYNVDHVTFNPKTQGNVNAFIFDNSLEP